MEPLEEAARPEPEASAEMAAAGTGMKDFTAASEEADSSRRESAIAVVVASTGPRMLPDRALLKEEPAVLVDPRVATAVSVAAAPLASQEEEAVATQAEEEEEPFRRAPILAAAAAAPLTMAPTLTTLQVHEWATVKSS